MGDFLGGGLDGATCIFEIFSSDRERLDEMEKICWEET